MSSDVGRPPRLIANVRELFGYLGSQRRRELYLLLGLMFAGAIAELASIGAVLPFLTLLVGPEGGGKVPGFTTRASQLAYDAGVNPILGASALFVFIALAAGAIRIQLAWSTQNFVSRVGHDLAVDIQRRILMQPYSFHIEQSSSVLLSSLDKVQGVVTQVLLPFLQAVIALVLAIFIVAALLAIDPWTAVSAAAIFAVIYYLVSLVTRERLARNSAVLAKAYEKRIKILQESLGGIRDVIIDGSQSLSLEAFAAVDRKLNRARATTAFIATAPRFVIESFGIALITIVSVAVWYREGSIAVAIPFLGVLALGAQRLLPLVQTVYLARSYIRAHHSMLAQVLDLLHLPISSESEAERPARMPFREIVAVNRVSFTYPTRDCAALDGVSLEIPRGSRVALVGKTGSGKSTLADLLMGLLDPDEGHILVDGVPLHAGNRAAWQRSIAHVPHSVFLADSSIAENIALTAREKLDSERVTLAAQIAQLHEFVMSLPGGYSTPIGENGVRLSAGQRQRLGIARAIYKDPQFLVLDEATSALDEQTEAAVLNAVVGTKDQPTMLIISHRASTLIGCDIVVKLQNGRLVEVRKT